MQKSPEKIFFKSPENIHVNYEIVIKMKHK